MLVTTQQSVQVLGLSSMAPTKATNDTHSTSVLTSQTTDLFNISTQDFESAFVFNAFSPSTRNEAHKVKARIYNPAESPHSSRSSSSIESCPPSSRASSVDMLSPVTGRSYSSFSTHSPASSISSVDLELGALSISKLKSEEHAANMIGPLPSSLSRPHHERHDRCQTTNGSSTTPQTLEATSTNTIIVSEQTQAFFLPRYFDISKSTTLPTEPRHENRRSIASSPWTCLEDAHHPLCTGSCDQGVFSSTCSPPSLPKSRKASVSSTARKRCPPVPPRNPKRTLSLTPDSLMKGVAALGKGYGGGYASTD